MGAPEMEEIASIITTVLQNTRPAKITKGPKAGTLSLSKAVTDPAVVEEARARVKALLGKFLLYPGLDLDFLQNAFCTDEE